MVVDWTKTDSAAAQVQEWAARVAAAKGWTAPDPATLKADLEEIRRTSSEVGQYLRGCGYYFRGLADRGVPNAEKLVKTMVSALQSSGSAEASKHAQSLLTIIGGTVVQTATDFKETGKAVGKFVSSPGGKIVLGLAAAAALGIVIKLLKR